MKKFTIFILSLIFSVGVFAQDAPNFTLTDMDGTEHTLYDYLDAGIAVVIDFFAVT